MMLKNKLLLLSFLLCLSGASAVNAEKLSEVEFPKPPAYRVGISEIPENQYVQAKQQKVKLEKTYAKIDDSMESSIMDVTYADLSIKRLSKEVAQELEFEEQDMIADLSLLWQGAAMQSDTINFALYKLANPDADKPDSKSVKKVLTTIASMSTLVGASIANPMLAGSSLIGGNILNIMSQDTKALNYKYTRVNDADMIILIRKVEDLQQNAVNLYYDYMSAKKQLELTTKLVDDRQRKFELAQQNNAQRELVVITDAYYRTSIDRQRAAKSEFFSKRAALEQFVGNETFVQFEADLKARENGEKPKHSVKNPENEPTYADTIQTVENYTNTIDKQESEVKNSVPNYAADEVEDANLDKVPEVKPLEIKEDNQQAESDSKNKDITETVPKTGFKTKVMDKWSSVTEKKESKSPSPEKQVKEKKKSEEIKPEKTVQKNSTKGLIFLHNNDNKDSKDSLEPLDSLVPTSQKQEKNIDLKLAPLDEIKAPDPGGKGYSIYSDEGY